MTSNSLNRISTLLGTALILLVLGLGNMYFGEQRSSEYRKLLENNQKSISSKAKPLLPLVESAVNVDVEMEHINRINSRINYYDLVTLGGKVFLALSGILLLLFLIRRKATEEID